MKNIYLISFILFSSLLFGEESSPSEKVITVSVGNKPTEIITKLRGGPRLPRHFAVDRQGNVYVDNSLNSNGRNILYIHLISGIVETINLPNSLHFMNRMSISENDNLVVGFKDHLVTIEGLKLNEVEISSDCEMIRYNRFNLFDEEILVKDKQYHYQFVNRLNYESITVDRLNEHFSEALDLKLITPYLNKFYVTDQGFIHSSDPGTLNEVLKLLYKDYCYNTDTCFSEIANDNELIFSGIDKYHNNYWYKILDDMSLEFFVYDYKGESIRKLKTSHSGNIPDYLPVPSIDSHGNIYIMQLWLDDKLEILKYSNPYLEN